jgi:hypothetical protein
VAHIIEHSQLHRLALHTTGLVDLVKVQTHALRIGPPLTGFGPDIGATCPTVQACATKAAPAHMATKPARANTQCLRFIQSLLSINAVGLKRPCSCRIIVDDLTCTSQAPMEKEGLKPSFDVRQITAR